MIDREHLELTVPDDPEPGWDEADNMCPNCLTPWRCNGPHLADETAYMQRLLAANRRGCTFWPVVVTLVVLWWRS
jgi:hypothetical protein